MVEELLEDYRDRHGGWPERLTFNLWSTETIRHEGIVESQILHAMGIRPVRDPRGTVTGVEAISRDELARPRVDVTVISSGLYRDLFPNLIQLLDVAAGVAMAQEEEDNHARIHMLAARRRLEADGVEPELAARLASVRIFGTAPGMYGTGLDDIIQASDAWDEEGEVAGVFFGRMSHAYGQGFWGERPEVVEEGLAGRRGLSVDLLKGALEGTRIAVHSRSTSLYGVLDTDDFFQYLGGTALAIRSLDGSSPELHVSNLMDPADSRHESLSTFMGREMRSRYLNPAWIEAMMAEGYAGARFMSRVVSHLWGWQVTAPEVVTPDRWNEFYETWVEDRNELGLREFFQEETHAWAYQTLVARMLETTRRGYWEPPPEVVTRLAAELARSVADAGAACNALVCNNTALLDYALSHLEAAPEGMAPAPEVLARAIAEARGELPERVDEPLPEPVAGGSEGADAGDAAEVPVPEGMEAPAPESTPVRHDPGADPTLSPVRGYAMERVEEGTPLPSPAHGSALRLYQGGMVLLLLALLGGWLMAGSARRPPHPSMTTRTSGSRSPSA